MMAPDILTAVIGTLAGGVTLSSSLPQVWSNCRRPTDAACHNPWRCVLQASGNALWGAYASFIGAAVMQVFALIGVTLALVLLWQIVIARR